MIRYLLALFPAVALAGWTERDISSFGIPDNPREMDAFYSWSRDTKGTDYAQCPPNGQICWLSLSAIGVPKDATAVELVAMVNITQPKAVSSGDGGQFSCWVEAQFGETQTWDKHWSVRSRSTAYGSRDMQSTWVAVRDGMIALSYRFWGTNGAANKPWPKGCSFMLRVSVSAYVR